MIDEIIQPISEQYTEVDESDKQEHMNKLIEEIEQLKNDESVKCIFVYAQKTDGHTTAKTSGRWDLPAIAGLGEATSMFIKRMRNML